MMAVQWDMGGREAPTRRPDGTGSLRQQPGGTWEGRYQDGGVRRYFRAPTREAAEARLAAALATAAPRPPRPTPLRPQVRRPDGSGSIRYSTGWATWTGRFHDAQGVRRSVKGATREEVEAKLAAATLAVARETATPSLAEWTGLKAPKAAQPGAVAVYQRIALSQLVQAVEAFLSGEAFADVLDLPLAAAHTALGGQDA